ncbi:YbhB/YbcL family Raf kinase inhibitor-like protein [uncultured Methylobacterium sp.]|uniref:YbhB/YbcL family Raf kinase inhibitor-like protein n=1 Tax=uncultured Methylobacterium sp. TaxID=157278 RepID=UPI0035C97E9C
MLEKIPALVGQALSGLRAGPEKTAYHADFTDVPERVALTSPAFAEGAPMPARFTEDGEGTSPPLAWSGLPEGTVRVAILAEDADSPTPQPLVHLIAWNLAATLDQIPEGALTRSGVADFRRDVGKNSFLKDGWLPPDPPTGHGAHRYLFQVYALDRALDLPARPGRGAVIDAMKGHVLGKGCLTGTYERA